MNFSKSIIRALLYYDIFHYPLTALEIHQNFDLKEVNLAEVKEELAELVQKKYVFKLDNFYSLRTDKELAERRKKGNKLAEKRMAGARRMSKLIGSFPFVRGVFLSGSISKNYMEPDSDIDYFVVTQTGRLWIARTLLKLFRIVCLFNSDKYFCVNYFISDDKLEIEEQNLFTAIELVTVVPTYNTKTYNGFLKANPWVKKYVPNFPPKNTKKVINQLATVANFFKKNTEWLLNGRLGEALDSFFMKQTIKHWKRKFPEFSPEERNIAFKSRRYVSKQHANNYQKKVLNKYAEKTQALEEQLGFKISKY